MSPGPWTVWLASYPKSGNTWTRAVLRGVALAQEAAAVAGGDRVPHQAAGSLVRAARAELDLELDALGGGPIASSRLHLESVLGFSTTLLRPHEIEAVRPACDAALDRQLTALRFRKIHDRLRADDKSEPIVPPAATRAAIYIVRDPRDVASSFAHHLNQTPTRAVAAMANADFALASTATRHNPTQVTQRLGTWSDHVRSWTDHDLFPVTVVRYEDLHTDPAGEFSRLAAFAGLDASRTQIEDAVDAARFDRLREKEREGRFREAPANITGFFRRGEAGAWRDELDPDLVDAVTAAHAEVMARLGYA